MHLKIVSSITEEYCPEIDNRNEPLLI